MKLLQKNREFAQFFLAVALKTTAVTTTQLLQFVAHSSITCNPVYLSKKEKSNRPPVVASGKRKAEENLIFHDNFIECSTDKFSLFAQHFGGKIRVFVATTCFVLPLSTPCCLLKISKCLWH